MIYIKTGGYQDDDNGPEPGEEDRRRCQTELCLQPQRDHCEQSRSTSQEQR